MLDLVHQDHFDQGLGQNLLSITPMNVEGANSVQNQHQYMDQFIDLN